MSDSPQPSFAELAADPAIAPLLRFQPVARTFTRKDGWSPEAQRMFIAWLAHDGSPSNACDRLGKSQSGVNKLYKRPEADEFRAAWDGAVALAERRRIAQLERRADAGGERGPSLDRGRVRRGRRTEPEPAPQEPSKDQIWELIHSIGLKFMRKVVAERRARLAGEIVAADFYLRQITHLEVILELTSKAFGWNVYEVLSNLRRGDHHVTVIVNTELTDWMDRSRRAWWAMEGDPERPAHPDVRFLQPRRDADGAYNIARDQGHLGACAQPARGYDAEAWAALTHGEQEAAWQRQYAEDAAEQAEWEARAYRDYEERRASDASA